MCHTHNFPFMSLFTCTCVLCWRSVPTPPSLLKGTLTSVAAVAFVYQPLTHLLTQFQIWIDPKLICMGLAIDNKVVPKQTSFLSCVVLHQQWPLTSLCQWLHHSIQKVIHTMQLKAIRCRQTYTSRDYLTAYHHHTVQVARSASMASVPVGGWKNTTSASCYGWNHHVCKWSLCANIWGRNTTT